MVIGNGLIASLFTDCDDEISDHVIFFASGVSNSLEDRIEAFEREENLIRETIEAFPNKIFLYFSTCSIYDESKKDSKYVLHKLKMEKIVEQTCPKYLIVRVSNAAGKGGNPHLLMNYIVNSVKNDEVLNVYTKATRNIIDVDDVKNITKSLVRSNLLNRIVNVAYPENYTVAELIGIVENFFKRKVAINTIEEGTSYEINCAEVNAYFTATKMNNKEKYMENILKKYFQ